MAILWRNAGRQAPKQLLLIPALSGAPSEVIDMLGLSRAFLTLLIATVALHVIGLAWIISAKDRFFSCGEQI
jgi:hypothetical protein